VVGPHCLAVLTIYKFNNGLRGLFEGSLPESGVGAETFIETFIETFLVSRSLLSKAKCGYFLHQ